MKELREQTGSGIPEYLMTNTNRGRLLSRCNADTQWFNRTNARCGAIVDFSVKMEGGSSLCPPTVGYRQFTVVLRSPRGLPFTKLKTDN